MLGRPALEQAIALLRTPTAARAMQAAPLPSDVGFLLRVLARDREAEAMAIKRCGRSIETIRDAAEFYAGEIMFAPQASAYRALASAPDASRDQLRTNMGLLLRWLHPDHRNTVERINYFERVVQAWELLSSPERRAEYDRRVAIASATAPQRAMAVAAGGRAPFFETTGQARSGRQAMRGSLRRWRRYALTTVILAGLAWLFVNRDRLNEYFDTDWLFGAASAPVLLAQATGEFDRSVDGGVAQP
jgi:hypothetical protein